ncbi:Uncharacterized protein PBTT_06273 [Plasmodiophora brassicae]|uniref:Uncharacterized protein n=1 Tax=Plasmodiophora brassicae TaxID=37360 RepID=A0A0G4J2X8_PLABS|nr:hypothetical protein PBRA_008641 [Plasmodiophora brassicae]SPQ98515.1 unnamed protein product [Plasmodiophora brassicae]
MVQSLTALTSISGAAYVLSFRYDPGTRVTSVDVTDGALVWRSSPTPLQALNDRAVDDYGDMDAFASAVVRALRRYDDRAFSYALDVESRPATLTVWRSVESQVGLLKQGLCKWTLEEEGEASASAIRSILMAAATTIDAEHAERKKLSASNARLTAELKALNEYHDRAVEAKAISEEQMILHIADLQQHLEKGVRKASLPAGCPAPPIRSEAPASPEHGGSPRPDSAPRDGSQQAPPVRSTVRVRGARRQPPKEARVE